MKKLILVIVLIASMMLLCSCNMTLLDTTYHFDWAQITMPDGSLIEGEVQSWTDYEGDQLQIKIDGKWYLVHAENVTMISE